VVNEKIRQLELTSSATTGANERTIVIMGVGITIFNIVVGIALTFWRERQRQRNGVKPS
jgi:hypothetical protein